MVKKASVLILGAILGLFVLVVGIGTASCRDDEAYKNPQDHTGGVENGVWYRIFVRSFADSDGDGIGDLLGIAQKLDYLNDGNDMSDGDLEVDGIILSPIFQSNSSHGYDVNDFYVINRDYGNLTNLQLLLYEARRRGIRVVLDLPMNSTGLGSFWFQEAVAKPDSNFRSYYHILPKDTPGYDFQRKVDGAYIWHPKGDIYYYGSQGPDRPDLNYDNLNVRVMMNEVARYWLEKGVDGFLLEGAGLVYSPGEVAAGVDTAALNLAWFDEFSAFCRQIKPDVVLAGDIRDSTLARSAYTGPFDMTLNYELAQHTIIEMVKAGQDLGGMAGGFNGMLEAGYKALITAGEHFSDVPFLSGYDQRRAMDYFSPGDLDGMKLAANIYLTLPGNPFIYYGEELGMRGERLLDNPRTPLPWGENDNSQTDWTFDISNLNTPSVRQQQLDPESLLSHYRTLVRLRRHNEPLLSGGFEGIRTNDLQLVAYKRTGTSHSIYVLHNLGEEKIFYDMNQLKTGTRVVLFASKGIFLKDKGVAEIPGRSTVVFR
ncbi:alpha-amylase family glycosyl hydrolase [Anaerotalea alkaliphila]|uniref:Glycosyl hydrolase family 13 catalytic domain-containing protein n=1 Tax=Anaerotalea alkaliphila TaxID=2662126 RepID=A0A7X5KNB3_9FIRM|nr:alpha-amylase family glycosyl hydrolase [Anaerotalea alkaliphila]NDL68689.1 hypothetical protein [Anaerotalea alkaliphila]